VPEFSKEKYATIISEIRDRILSAEIFSNEKNRVFIESTSLQIRKILELIAYLSVLVNSEKLNHKQRNEYHASKIIDSLIERTTIFYPLPSHMIHPSKENEQPVLIPLGFNGALTQEQFRDTYQLCGKVVHAQHPLKPDLDIQGVFQKNKEILDKIKSLIRSHTIGIRKSEDKYTFLHVEIDFSNHETTKPSFIREYNAQIYSEKQLIEIFNAA